MHHHTHTNVGLGKGLVVLHCQGEWSSVVHLNCNSIWIKFGRLITGQERRYCFLPGFLASICVLSYRPRPFVPLNFPQNLCSPHLPHLCSTIAKFEMYNVKMDESLVFKKNLFLSFCFANLSGRGSSASREWISLLSPNFVHICNHKRIGSFPRIVLLSATC